MAGYNSCVFAYGQVVRNVAVLFVDHEDCVHALKPFNCLQTGSGKTYTMLGEISDLEVRPSPERGMTPRIFEFLFARIRAVTDSPCITYSLVSTA